MTLSKETVIDRIEITENGCLQVWRAAYVLKDGVRISAPRYHHKVYVPAADVTVKGARVRTLCNAVWAPECVAAYRAKVVKQEARQ